jgi:membrane fusion protein (multidrug efflux system)
VDQKGIEHDFDRRCYVNEHVTFVAPRVFGQVSRVFVDDDNRVHKGDILFELDSRPYQVQVQIAEAAVAPARSDLVAAMAATRATVGKARSLRFNLQHSIEQVDNQIALLKANVATFESQKASLTLAQENFHRAEKLITTRAIAQEEYDQAHSALLVTEAQVKQSLEGVYQSRVGSAGDSAQRQRIDRCARRPR